MPKWGDSYETGRLVFVSEIQSDPAYNVYSETRTKIKFIDVVSDNVVTVRDITVEYA